MGRAWRGRAAVGGPVAIRSSRSSAGHTEAGIVVKINLAIITTTLLYEYYSGVPVCNKDVQYRNTLGHHPGSTHKHMAILSSRSSIGWKIDACGMSFQDDEVAIDL